MTRFIAWLITKLTNVAHFLLKFILSEEFLLQWKPIHLCWWFIKHGLPVPKYFIAKSTFTPAQNKFRFYEEGTESGSNPIANQDTNITPSISSDYQFHLRLLIQETGGLSGATTDDWQLQYSRNSGTYTNIDYGSSYIRARTSFSSDGGATTNRSTNGITDGTGSFVAGEICQDGLLDDFQLTASNFTEHLFGLSLLYNDVSNGDTIDFRLLLNGAVITYNVTPRITVTKNSLSGTVGMPTELTKGLDTDGGSSSTTASITPTASKLVILAIRSRTNITADPSNPTISGCNLTWNLITDKITDDGGTSREKMWLYRGFGASPTTGGITIDFGGQAQTHTGWIVNQFGSGVDTATNDGIVQSSTASILNAGPADITLSTTLAAFGSTDNATFGFFSCFTGNNSATAGSGFSIVSHTADAAGTLDTEFRPDNDTGVDFWFPSSLNAGVIAVEIKALVTTPTINVSDSITVTESVTMQVVDSVNVSDAITATEAITVREADNVNVSDAVTTAESVTLMEVDNPNISDSVTVTESITLLIPILYINISDSITVTESVTLQVVDSVSVSDSITTSEAVTLNEVDSVNVSDSVTAAESVTLMEVLNVNVSDSITVAESVTLLIPLGQANVSDAITATESVTLMEVSNVNVSDSITVAEAVTLQLVDNVNVSDSVTASEAVTLSEVFNINVSDAISVAESVALSVVDYVNVTDSITVAEAVTVQIITVATDLNINVSDAVTVTEAVTLQEVSYINVVDSVTVSEAVTLQIVNNVNVSDTVSVAESVTASEVSNISVSDAITVVDVLWYYEDIIIVNENVTLSQVNNINVSDSVTVSESVALSIVNNINVSDSVSVNENVTVQESGGVVNLDVNVSDSITVTESVTTSGVLNISLLAAAIGKALDFERDNSQYVDIGQAASSLRLTGTKYSIAFWMKVESLPGATMRIINMDDGNDFSGGYSIIILATGNIHWTHNSGSSNSWDTGYTVSTGSWIHVVCVYDQTNKILYINGSSNNTDPTTSDLTSDNNDPLWFGGIEVHGQHFDGILDQILIYNDALTSGQVSTIYNSGNGTSNIPTSSLIGRWELDEGTGTSVADSSGNGFNGTLKPTGTEPAWVDGKVLTSGGGETITVTESVLVSEVLNVNVSDSITVAESVILTTDYYINVSDALTVAESITAQAPIGGFINVSDSVTVAESVTLQLENNINVVDTVTVTEAVSLSETFNINVLDSVTANEAVQEMIVNYINVSDAISAAEQVTLVRSSLTYNINVRDVIGPYKIIYDDHGRPLMRVTKDFYTRL